MIYGSWVAYLIGELQFTSHAFCKPLTDFPYPSYHHIAIILSKNSERSFELGILGYHVIGTAGIKGTNGYSYVVVSTYLSRRD